MCSKFSFEYWWFQNDQWERCLFQSFLSFKTNILRFSSLIGPSKSTNERTRFYINKKTCLNDYVLCILLFQHRILWYYELSKYHLKLLSNNLPKNKNIFYPNIYPKLRRFIFWTIYLLDTLNRVCFHLTPNLTRFLNNSMSHRNDS